MPNEIQFYKHVQARPGRTLRQQPVLHCELGLHGPLVVLDRHRHQKVVVVHLGGWFQEQGWIEEAGGDCRQLRAR